VLLCADADAAAADLASGALACPSCGTRRLRAWGYGRDRIIRVTVYRNRPGDADRRIRKCLPGISWSGPDVQIYQFCYAELMLRQMA
jgi:hypothetical protein